MQSTQNQKIVTFFYNNKLLTRNITRSIYEKHYFMADCNVCLTYFSQCLKIHLTKPLFGWKIAILLYIISMQMHEGYEWLRKAMGEGKRENDLNLTLKIILRKNSYRSHSVIWIQCFAIYKRFLLGIRKMAITEINLLKYLQLCNFTKSNAPPWLFLFTFFRLCK